MLYSLQDNRKKGAAEMYYQNWTVRVRCPKCHEMYDVFGVDGSVREAVCPGCGTKRGLSVNPRKGQHPDSWFAPLPPQVQGRKRAKVVEAKKVDRILALRAKGLSYKEISAKTRTRNGVVSWLCVRGAELGLR